MRLQIQSALLGGTAAQQGADLLVRINDAADGHIVVDGGDEVGDVLGHVHLKKPLTSAQLRVAVGQVGAQHRADGAPLLRLV